MTKMNVRESIEVSVELDVDASVELDVDASVVELDVGGGGSGTHLQCSKDVWEQSGGCKSGFLFIFFIYERSDFKFQFFIFYFLKNDF